MLSNIKNLYAPRLLIFLLDVSASTIAVYIAYQLRFNFNIPVYEWLFFRTALFSIVGAQIFGFTVFRIYNSSIRYTGARDLFKILFALSLAAVLVIGAGFISRHYTGLYLAPISIVIIDFLIILFFLVIGRMAVRVLYHEITNPTRVKSKVIIYGAGDAGIIAKRSIDRDAGTRFKVFAFVDDDTNRKGKSIEGVKVFETHESLETLLQENEIKHLIIAIAEISKRRKAEIADICLRYNTKVLDVPPVKSWIKGELSFKQIKKIKIEDLLERDPIVLDNEKIASELSNKRILITGAAGSIGSELVRQVINFNPAELTLLDTAESALYDLEQELKSASTLNNIIFYIADIKNEIRLSTIFDRHKPEVVFHAAAYKHVPLMEDNVSEAVANNIFGTCMVTDTAMRFGCKKMVMVSTDKAVNPTNVMGASKRIAEMYCQWQNNQQATRFVTTRFGNVLGSNGSVIPLFKKQIEEGKNITVTHPDITRYFMTIPEACQLVLEAGAIGQGGEIFVFDMGTPVRIADLANKMITLSGLKEGRDIEIKYTGLRPGEKLYEELLNDSEHVVPTHHPKIKKAKLANVDGDGLRHQLNHLKNALMQQDDLKMVGIMKELVPEFISNNSFYSSLDEKKDKR